MSQYSCIEIIKTKAKKMSRIDTSITHVQALESIAQQSNFSSYHELKKVAKNTPFEPRLMMAAFGDLDFSDTIHNYYDNYADGPYSSFESAVEEELSSAIASTNANGFVIEDFNVIEADYDEAKGALRLKVTFLYQGDQMPDHVYSATDFSVDAFIGLLWRDERWQFIDEDFEISNVESDLEHYYFDNADQF